MTNFYYGGEQKQENVYVRYGNGEKPCDECGDIYDRAELCYIIPEYTYNDNNNNDNEDLEQTAWTFKLCGPCLTSIIHEHDEHNENRRMQRNKL